LTTIGFGTTWWPSVVARFGIGRFLTASTLVAAVGLGLLLRFPATSTYPLLGVVLFVVGVGTTSTAFAATVAGSAGVSDDEQGLSSALINAARQVGAALGVAILLSVAAASNQGRTGSTAALADGYRTAMAVAAGLALVAAVISLRLVHRRTHRRRFAFSASRRTSVNGSSSREVGEHTVLSS
jgi:MFS family permease